MIFRLLIVVVAFVVTTLPGRLTLTTAGRVFAGLLAALLTTRSDFDAGGVVTPQGKALVDGNLNGRQLTGTIPAQMGEMTALVKLYLNQNSLSGTISPQLRRLSSLEVLWLHNNKLTGSIPPEISKLTALTSL
jgi:Leucine-rich repeat (LRR) protein